MNMEDNKQTKQLYSIYVSHAFFTAFIAHVRTLSNHVHYHYN